jgi:hypothetical protein
LIRPQFLFWNNLSFHIWAIHYSYLSTTMSGVKILSDFLQSLQQRKWQLDKVVIAFEPITTRPTAIFNQTNSLSCQLTTVRTLLIA